MEGLGDQVLLVMSATALSAAALRTASLAAPAGLERVVSAAPLAVGAAVGEALLLGLLRLGGSPVALATAAAVTWLAAQLWLPTPRVSIARDLRGWWLLAAPGSRLAVSALAGAGLGLAAWALRHPYFGLDGVTYHLAEAVAWVQHGTPGSVQPVFAALPVGNYPVTNEIVLGWAIGLSHSFAPLALWMTALLALFVAAAWLGLRTLSVPGLVAVLAIVALVLVPVTLREIVQEPETDFPALTWLVATGALSAVAAAGRPAVLAPALVAAGLAVGTKTTTLPLVSLALAAAGWSLRGHLREIARPLGLAAAAALVAGGVWYLRNLIDHGSPLWPLVTTPWGDPLPAIVERLNFSFFDRPRATLASGILSFYRDQLAGILLVVAAALLAPLWARRRAVAAATGATVLAILLWANAPFTGVSRVRTLQLVPFNTLRYALPVLVAATFALALSARGSARSAAVAAVVFVAAAAWSLERYVANPYLPSDGNLVAFVLAGAAGAIVIARLARGSAVVWGGAALAICAVALAVAGSGYVERRTGSNEVDSGLVAWFRTRPAWRDGHAPVAVSPMVIGTLAGDRLRHRIALVGPAESCTRIAGRVRAGWVVVGRPERNVFPPLTVSRCLARARPSLDIGGFRVYGSGGG